MVGKPSTQDEKLHVMAGASVDWKSPLYALPLRRSVVRDGTGKAIVPTLATGRRKKNAKANGRTNTQLNKPNQGVTWTAKLIQSVLLSRAWLPHLKQAVGVVLDA